MEDADLIEVATEFRAGILDGRSSERMCAVVTWPLQGYLKFLGVNSEILHVDFKTPSIFCNHIFLRLDDNRILDATADQFPESGLPSVYLGPLPECYYDWANASGLDTEGAHRLHEVWEKTTELNH